MDRAGPTALGLRTASGLQALMIDNDSTMLQQTTWCTSRMQHLWALSPFSLNNVIL